MRLKSTAKIFRRIEHFPEFGIWSGIVQRCTNPNNPRWSDYGGRGISVCEEWKRSFLPFFRYVGKRPTELHSIDRFPDNNGNYEPGNVRWATRIEQANNRRNTLWIEVGNVRLSAAEYSRTVGVPYSLACKMAKRDDTPAVTIEPVNPPRLQLTDVEVFGSYACDSYEISMDAYHA